jgi:hypothetical protein
VRHALLWLRPRPNKRFEREPERRGALRQRSRLGGRFGAQPVIDMQGDDAPAASARPAIGEAQKGRRIAAAGPADGQQRGRLEGSQCGKRRVERVLVECRT